MNANAINNKVLNATKWSALTSVASRIATPITSMILARLLAPEAFGILATITMVISFAEIFADSGFQKFLVQRDFENVNEKYDNANVAFWTNLAISLMLWLMIVVFSKQIAILVGNPNLNNVLIIAGLQLPITSFTSIQFALYRRDFNFKILFSAKVISLIVPFVVTIPLAIMGFSYWSLIIGNITGQVVTAIILLTQAKWKPRLYFSFNRLKRMLSFSIWSMIEDISIWLTIWIDIFIISIWLDEYYLGLYRTSTTMVKSLLAIVTATVLPVLFSALSRLQNDDSKYKELFYRIQKTVAYLVLPLGFGMFVYSDLATSLILGPNWADAHEIIGIWALTSSIIIITSNMNSEVYRSKGKPHISFISQLISLSFLIPTCLISVKYGFWIFVYSRTLIRFQGVVTGLFIMRRFMGFPIIGTLKNISKPFLLSIMMGILAIYLKNLSNSILWHISSILICALFYLTTVLIFSRNDFIKFMNFLKRKSIQKIN